VYGKFNQFAGDVPYAALVQALRQLIQLILTESESSLALWRDALKKALAGNGEVIIEVIPEVEFVIGNCSSSLEQLCSSVCVNI
jgi:predicted ATPase